MKNIWKKNSQELNLPSRRQSLPPKVFGRLDNGQKNKNLGVGYDNDEGIPIFR